MSIEDRLRDALQATANTVDDQTHRPLPERRPRPSMLRLRLVPLGAVAGVLIILVSFLTAQRLWDDPAERLQRTPVMPKFIFASTVDGGDTPNDSSYSLEVRESATGRLVDRYKAPKGFEFGGVAALSDNRTFYVTSELKSQKPCRTTIQRVRVSDAGKIIGMEPIAGGPVAGVGSGNGGLAVTPNDTKLAYAVQDCSAERRDEASAERTRIAVVDLVTNTQREWHDSGQGDGANQLSWAADGGHLFFVRRVEHKDSISEDTEELRRIKSSVPGGAQLAGNSKLIQTVKSPSIYVSALARPDGLSVFTSTMELQLGVGSEEPGSVPDPSRDSQGPVELLELSAQDGRVLRQIRLASASRLEIAAFKSDASGLYLLTSGGIVDLHKGGPARPLKGLDGVVDMDW
ncbi:hypothetical protein [Actinomadura rudentiformis]|uniref:Lactonase family protein n=1 Tax=Actinomadura rudentiformis TaxID=359158 RepID=A0A6H9YUI9_9ACTN|nr:hypothetical protein [Actinomadura rudentiformis]KAB2345940.1 hypothetical protein F8566_24790 [Actinomadura rudentiformis]